jgi:hypothetical protein
VVWQGQGLMYHGSGLYVCLVLLALLTVAALMRLLLAGPPMRRIGAGILLAGFLLGIANRIRTFYVPPLQYLVGRMSAQDYYSRYTAGELNVAEAFSFVDTIRSAGAEVNGPEKTILVWSLATMINNESGYRNATRFHTPTILLVAKAPFPRSAEWRRLFIADIKRANPFACVVATQFVHDTSDEAVQFVRQLVRERYRPVASTAEVTLYLRLGVTVKKSQSDRG